MQQISQSHSHKSLHRHGKACMAAQWLSVLMLLVSGCAHETYLLEQQIYEPLRAPGAATQQYVPALREENGQRIPVKVSIDRLHVSPPEYVDGGLVRLRPRRPIALLAASGIALALGVGFIGMAGGAAAAGCVSADTEGCTRRDQLVTSGAVVGSLSIVAGIVLLNIGAVRYKHGAEVHAFY